MSVKEKYNLLKTLTLNELKEICKLYSIKGYSKYKKNELAKFVAENLDIPQKEVENLVNSYWEDRLLSKIKDAEDYFLNDKVLIDYFDDDIVKAQVGDYDVKIVNLGTKDFTYYCDEKCNDYQYQVKSGRYPFCKHYPAVIAELLYGGHLDITEIEPNYISGKVLESLMSMVDARRKLEGTLPFEGRSIQEKLENLKSDFIKISKQNAKIAREKYHDKPERVFENMVDDAFQLLEFETIPRHREHGWDMIVIGTYATPPYIIIVECKTAANGIYDHIIKSPEYLVHLKNYCIELCKEKLIGVYKDYVKYMVMVGPDFPEEIVEYCPRFQQMSNMKLSFLPASTLLYWVEKYRENPIVTHSLAENLFKKGIIRKKDIDELFNKAEKHLQSIINHAKSSLRNSMEEICQHHTDATYIKLDEITLRKIIKGIITTLQPHLLKKGLNEATGVETISIKHDYYKLWEAVLQALAHEFANILKEHSLSQVKPSDLKKELTKSLI